MKGLRQYFFEERKLKILSFVIALILWAIVNHGTQREVIAEARIKISKIRNGLQVKRLDNEKIAVRLKGAPFNLKELDEVDLFLDLSDYEEGTHIYRIRKTDFRLPKGISIEEVKPTIIKIELERK